MKRENEAEVNKLKSSKNSFNDSFVSLVENIRVSELEKTVKKQKLEIEKKTKENMDLKDSNDGLSNQITIWEESNKNLQDEMSKSGDIAADSKSFNLILSCFSLGDPKDLLVSLFLIH